jgi:hypothetical protein
LRTEKLRTEVDAVSVLHDADSQGRITKDVPGHKLQSFLQSTHSIFWPTWLINFKAIEND